MSGNAIDDLNGDFTGFVTARTRTAEADRPYFPKAGEQVTSPILHGFGPETLPQMQVAAEDLMAWINDGPSRPSNRKILTIAGAIGIVAGGLAALTLSRK